MQRRKGLAPLPKPKQKVTIVEEHNSSAPDLRAVNGYWVFGPRTKYKWPLGDFHHGTNTRRVGQSAWSMEALLRLNMVIYDPDLQMDEGL